MKKWLLAFGLTLAAASPAYAFRCGSHVITEGDTRSVLRRPLVWIGGRPVSVGESLIEIPVEVWIYNLGPSKLMRKLRFEDGVLVDIDTMGYGYYENQPPPDARKRREDDDRD
jgi:hypothetical protein